MLLDSFNVSACNLINNEMKQFIISSETDAIREAEERVSHTDASYICVYDYQFIIDYSPNS